MVIGIDPGVQGAVGIVRGSRFVAVHDLPMLTTAQGKRQPNPQALHQLLRDSGADQIIIETVNAMPSVPGGNGQRRTMGATSAFNFGHGAGIIFAAAMLSGIPVKTILPRAWKARAGLLRTPKDHARTRALQLFPGAPLHRVKDQGRADALLIALFGQ